MYLYIEVYAIREVSMASAAILLIMIVSIQKAQNLAGLKAGIRRPYVVFNERNRRHHHAVSWGIYAFQAG